MNNRPEKPSYGVVAGFVGLGLITSKLLYAYSGNPTLSLLTGAFVAIAAGWLAGRESHADSAN